MTELVPQRPGTLEAHLEPLLGAHALLGGVALDLVHALDELERIRREQLARVERGHVVTATVHPAADLDRSRAGRCEHGVVAREGVGLDVALAQLEILERRVRLVGVLLVRGVQHVAVPPVANMHP